MHTDTISEEFLLDSGFKAEATFGFTKEIGDLTIMVGNFPRNELCVSLRFLGVEATVITNATNDSDIAELERLLGNSFIDDDCEETIDGSDIEDDDFDEAEDSATRDIENW